MKPTYMILKHNHYSSNKYQSNYLDQVGLYKEIGYDFHALHNQNPAYENTCATRMSLALIKSGIHFHGRLEIKAGPYKGRKIETGAKLLADQLAKPHVFELPLILRNPNNAPTELNNTKGVLFFNKIAGYGGGHIDLIDSINK